MVTYTNNELIPSTEFAKKFGTFLSQLQANTVEKIAVLKNNHIEAVLVSKDEYEKMKEALELIEHQEIYRTIRTREDKPYKTISFEDMAKKHKITI